MNTNIIPKKSTVIVGFSGGPDSVYLLEQIYELRSTHGITVIAAHLDHEWRANSSEDRDWCKKYCEEKQIPFVSEKISNLLVDPPKTGSKEASARFYRRFFLEAVANKYDNSLVALGHHLDDQIETFFIRLARGTTLAGIGCIKTQDGIYIRPLLSIAKKEILDYLTQRNIPFLIDPTNTDKTILRNHIRANLIPELEKIDPRFIPNIERTINHLQGAYQAFKSATKKIYLEMLENGWINTEQFLDQPNPIKEEIISKILIFKGCKVTQSNSLLAEIIRFLKNGKSKEHLLHPTCKIKKNKGRFSIINPTTK